MAWGDKATLTGLNVSLSEVTNVDANYTDADHYTEWVTLNPGETADIQIEVLFGSTGNDIIYRVIKTLDAATENADTVVYTGGTVPFVASITQRRPHAVSNCYKFRIELRKNGTTAGAYTPNVYIRKNGISV